MIECDEEISVILGIKVREILTLGTCFVTLKGILSGEWANTFKALIKYSGISVFKKILSFLFMCIYVED